MSRPARPTWTCSTPAARSFLLPKRVSSRARQREGGREEGGETRCLSSSNKQEKAPRVKQRQCNDRREREGRKILEGRVWKQNLVSFHAPRAPTKQGGGQRDIVCSWVRWGWQRVTA
mmetsp:Transcript_37448/g.58516  ORF Transcript_37448/g.58516 Transcript_37448/m.58516 type:complete len:117 (+) Transcript_37448:394-744(+)